MSAARRPTAYAGQQGSHGQASRSGEDNAPYVAVVVDHRLGTVESYGPLPAFRAARMLGDLRALLRADGIGDVSVTACALHAPGLPPHPDDP